MTGSGRLLVFLSHSSRDKAFVRRLNKDLRSRSIDTWLDEQDIPLGGSITEHLQSGLNKADVILIFLSDASVASRWVSTEWQTSFFRHMSSNNITIVPIVLNDCTIPSFLADRRYLDFRKKEAYEENLSTLLSFLSGVSSSAEIVESQKANSTFGSVLEITKDILDDMGREQISLPTHRRMPIVQTLKSLPRSGKKVRLESFKPSVKIRTIYDHLLSLAHLADCLLPYLSHTVDKQEFSDIALCIAYHEINEVVLGDIPTYTSLNNHKRNTARIYAEQRLRTVPPAERERISNEFIAMFLSDKHRRALEAANKIMADTSGSIYVMFKSLDKIDPIVATWRYLHHYRGKLGSNPRTFNTAMKDFYENPDVKSYLRANRVDHALIDLVLKLQDRKLAWDYYEDPNRIFGNERLFEIPAQVARQAIEGIKLFSDD